MITDERFSDRSREFAPEDLPYMLMHLITETNQTSLKSELENGTLNFLY